MTTLGRRPVHAYDGIEHSYRFPHPECLLCQLNVLAQAAFNLIEVWDMSADSLGPEWVGMGKRVDDLRHAVEASNQDTKRED